MFHLRNLLFAALVLCCNGSVVFAQTYNVGSVMIEQPWARATPGGAKVAAGYMKIVNNGAQADRLIGGSLPQAGRFEVHEMKMVNGVMEMRPIPGGLEIASGQTVELKPGGYHVMFMDLQQPLKQGERLKGQLRFEKAGVVEVEYQVEAVGARGPGQHGH
jgi:copper(I)-binding protein